MASAVVCLTTISSRQAAERLAGQLVKEKLAACVNIVPGIISHYSWKKKLCREAELLLVIKTFHSKLSRLEKRLIQLHPYEVPEFVAISMTQVSKPYLSWMRETLKD